MIEDETNISGEGSGNELPPGLPIDWEAWLAIQGPKLLLFARQKARSMPDAEDILQDALVKLVKQVESGALPRTPACWAPYVYAVIQSYAINYGKKSDRRAVHEGKACMDTEQHESHPWFEVENDHELLGQEIETCLKEMPSKFAEVIILKIWGDLTFREIADTLDIPLNTVSSRYRYGIAYLRKSITEEEEPPTS